MLCETLGVIEDGYATLMACRWCFGREVEELLKKSQMLREKKVGRAARRELL